MKMELKPRPCDAPWRFYEKPEGTIEYRQIIDGWLRTWQEYVPSCYDGREPVPLVLSLHGAAHHSADSYTAWQLIAERENFIVVYPHSLIEEIKFNVWEAFGPDDGMPDDVQYIDRLIDIICGKYNIDPGRIYMQGQSVGDNMASTYLFVHGDRIAAAAPLSGPASCSTFYHRGEEKPYRYPHCAVPVIRTHGSEDTQQPLGGLGKICIMSPSGEEKPKDLSDTARYNKWAIGQRPSLELWKSANGCDPLPRLGLRGRYSWAVYAGQPCDLIYYVVEGGEHGPYLDMADNIWTYFFSHYRRVGGKAERIAGGKSVEPDSGAIALADGAALAYVDNRPVQLDGDGRTARAVNGSCYVPAGFLEKAFPGARVLPYNDGKAIRMRIGGNELQAAMGNRCVVWNESLRDMPTTMFFDGCLYLPIAPLAELVLGFKESAGRGAYYLNAFGGAMSFDFSCIIKELLGTQRALSVEETLDLEDGLRRSGNMEYAPHNVAGDKYSGTPEEIFALLKKKYTQELENYLGQNRRKGV